MKLFCGYDQREAIGFHVFVSSVIRHASRPIELIPIDADGNPQGTNAFTYSRFSIPSLMGYKGMAVFADASDMLAMCDLNELENIYDPRYAVQVVKHSYKTRNPIKYLGTTMQCPNVDYYRKNWASFMVMNCRHDAWLQITPEKIKSMDGLDLLQFKFLKDSEIGELPDEWNRLVDEAQPVEGAKVLHWTAGIPGFPIYKAANGAELWRSEYNRMLEIP